MEWYTIPGFRSYEISSHTRLIRSLKHYKKDCFHIMKVSKAGTVQVTDDYGVSRRMRVDDLYDITFNQGNELKPRGDRDVWKGGMIKANRSMIADVDILGGTQNPTKNVKQQTPVNLSFAVPIAEDNSKQTFTLDFSKLSHIKPFTFENR